MNKDILLEWDSKHIAMKRTKEHYWKTYRKWRGSILETYYLKIGLLK